MAYVVRITVMSLLMSMVCSSGLVNVLDKKINGIREAMEAEIAFLRHDMGNVSSQLAHLWHGMDGFSRKVQNVSYCGCEKTDTRQTSDPFIFNQVIRNGFVSEKKLLKKEVEMIQRNVNLTMNDVDRMNRSMTSYKVDNSETKSHVKRINDITVYQSREILAIKEHMESGMTRKGFESEKSLENDILAIKQQMNSFMTKLDSLNETFKRRLEAVERDVSASRGFEAKIKTLEAAFNKRSEYSLKALGSVRKHGESIYVRPVNGANYYSATKICSGIGGYLVQISSEEENAFIKQTFITSSDTFILLGGSNEITEGNWKWARSGDHIPLRNQGGFQKWAAGEPNNSDSKVHCMIMKTNGEWSDELCRSNFVYVCESDLI